MIEVRPYAPEDHAAVVANLQEADMYNPLCEAQENYAALTAEHPESILVAELDSEVIGSVAVTNFGINIALIWRLVVAERHQRNGVASTLLHEAERSIKDRGFQEIWAFADDKDNDLIEFYKNRGWQWFKNPKTYASLWK